MFGVCVDAGADEVTVSRGGEGLEIEIVGGEGGGLPTEPHRNTAGRAVAALLERQGVRESLRLSILKGTRPGSGLGSSAASAAAAVVATDALLGLGLSREALVAAAAEGERAAAGAAHPDNVAASICGGFVVVSRETPLRLLAWRPAESIGFVVATPDIRVTTSVARDALPSRVSLADYSRGCARCAMIVAAMQTGDAAALGRVIEDSFVDACRESLIPGCAAVRAAARDAGAAGTCISGAGPTLAAVIGPDADGERVAAAMRAAFSDAGLESVARVVSVADGARVIGRES